MTLANPAAKEVNAINTFEAAIEITLKAIEHDKIPLMKAHHSDSAAINEANEFNSEQISKFCISILNALNGK